MSRLPGIGYLHVVALTDDRRIGVIQRTDGRRNLVFYDPADPDTSRVDLLLTPPEADLLAALLGADGPPLRCARLDRHPHGPAVLQVLIGADSACLGRSVTSVQVAGATVVALIRDDLVVDRTTPCAAGDVVVVVGPPDDAFAMIEALHG